MTNSVINNIANALETDNTSNKTDSSANTSSKNETVNSNNDNGTARNLKGKINVETANVREKPDKKSPIIETLDEGDEVTIIEEVDGWYKITNKKISSGYVSKSLVTINEVTSRKGIEQRDLIAISEEDLEKINNALNNSLLESNEISKNDISNETVSSNQVSNNEIIEFAKKFLGYNYVAGGKTPETGFDCSGFTQYIFKNFGYSLGSSASSQNTLGREVSKEELKSGDLLLFYDEGKTKIGHVGIYIDGDKFIHAANPQRGVVIDEFTNNEYYFTRFVSAKRIIE